MDKNKFDIEIKREGWDKMKNILDSEMPVKKRRFLPFILLFLILGTIGISFLYSKTNEKKQKELIYKKEAVLEIQIHDKNIEKKEIITDTVLNKVNKTDEKINTKDNESRNKNIKLNIKKNNELENKQYDFIAKTEEHNDTKKPENLNSQGISNIESKSVPIKNIKVLNISLFEIEQRLLLAEFDFNDLIINRKKKPEFFNPFIGVKVHSYNYKEFAPKYELDLGSYFKISNRFSFGIGIAYVQTDLMFQSVQEESYVLFDNGIEKENYNYNYEAESFDLPAWTFELMLKEKYNINRKFTFDFGGGMVLGGFKSAGLKYDSTMATNNRSESDFTNFKPVIFGDVCLYYNLTSGINAGLGYKYYYSGTYNINDNNREIYSQKLINKKYSSRFYLGINYYF